MGSTNDIVTVFVASIVLMKDSTGRKTASYKQQVSPLLIINIKLNRHLPIEILPPIDGHQLSREY